MKQFFGAFFGSLVGIIVATLLAILVIVVVVKTSISSLSENKEEVSLSKPNSILKIVLDGAVNEREKENPFKGLGDNMPFGGEAELGLNTFSRRLRNAKDDDNIKGIYLCVRQMQAGFATLSEMRNALEDFKTSGKFIYAYAENYSQKEYFIASVANKVFINPQGNLDWTGLHMNFIFFKQAFEKLDVDMQVFRHGKFKSAVEPFLLDKMSQANRFQSESFLASIWNSMLVRISHDRQLSAEQLNKMANDLAVRFPEDVVGSLVDAAVYEDQVVETLKRKIGVKQNEKLKFVDFSKYSDRIPYDPKAGGSKIAVIYANGAISSGQGDDEQIGSERLSKCIREARLDDKVKAIVLRVNSPGGSALASDVIWREMSLAKKAKPVVVSMGDVAASGGYYISCAADKIFAQPNTITGSIGVFGLIPNFQRMLEKKLGITVDTVNTNKYSDIGTGLRPVTQKEFEFIQGSVEKVYGVFTSRVAEGRKMSQADVDSIGQGRVWSGVEAQKIGLVDELGGLDDAVLFAASKAKIKEYKIMEMPKQRGPLDGLLGMREDEIASGMMKRQLGPLYGYIGLLQQVMNLRGIQTRLPFEIVFD